MPHPPGAPTNPTLIASGHQFPPTFMGQQDRVFSKALHLITALEKAPGLVRPKLTPFAVTYLFPHALGGFAPNDLYGLPPDRSFLTLIGVPFSQSIREERDRQIELFEDLQRRQKELAAAQEAQALTSRQLLELIASKQRTYDRGQYSLKAELDLLRGVAVSRGLINATQTLDLAVHVAKPSKVIEAKTTVPDQYLALGVTSFKMVHGITGAGLPAHPPDIRPAATNADLEHAKFVGATVGDLAVALLMFAQAQNPADP